LLTAGAASGWLRVAVLSAGDAELEIVCVVDAQQAGCRCGGVPIVGDNSAAQARASPAPLDRLMLTDTRAPQMRFEELLAAAQQHGLRPDQLVAPSLLGISVVSARAGGGGCRRRQRAAGLR
jgi:hypothetical protein